MRSHADNTAPVSQPDLVSSIEGVSSKQYQIVKNLIKNTSEWHGTLNTDQYSLN
jgi:hypothetical protein